MSVHSVINDISRLTPLLQVIVKEFMRQATQIMPCKVFETYRTKARQDWCVAQGTSTVKYPNSFHSWGLAVDILPLDDNGNVTWNPKDKEAWNKLGAIGKSLGLEWGGDWKSFVDVPHYQLTFGYTTTQYKNGTLIPLKVSEGCKDKRLVSFIQNLVGADQDGIWGTKTTAAVKLFNPKGFVDAATLQEMIDRKFKPETEKTEDIGVTLMQRFRYIDEVPDWARPTIQKLVDKKFLSGTGDGVLDLSLDMIRILVLNDNAGLYGK